VDYSAAIRRSRARSIIGPAMTAADPIVRLTLDFIYGIRVAMPRAGCI